MSRDLVKLFVKSINKLYSVMTSLECFPPHQVFIERSAKIPAALLVRQLEIKIPLPIHLISPAALKDMYTW